MGIEGDINGASGERMEDLQAVEDECNYIMRVLKNFSARIKEDDAPTEVKTLLVSFFGGLGEFVSGVTSRRRNDNGDEVNCGDNKITLGKGQHPTSTPVKSPNITYPTGPGMCVQPCANTSVTIDDLVHALGRLDNKPSPPPEIFDTGSGQSFQNFLKDFEEFADRKFGGQRGKWGTELRQFLKGEPLAAFEALRIPGEDYDSLKDKLTDWLASSQDKLEHDAKRRFSEARREGDERVRLFAARLEKLFRLAYPRRSTDANKTLREKFVDTAPGRFREQLLTAQAITQATNGSELSWPQMVSMASQYDAKDFSRIRAADDSARRCEEVNIAAVSGRQEHPGFSRRWQASNTRANHSAGPGHKWEDLVCSYCDRTGHEREDCRRRRGLCFVCGSERHRVATCPERRSGMMLQEKSFNQRSNEAGASGPGN